ncbi:hypothetical protein [Natronogracilivirga saccharolytica]|uniref:Uncharacterized protein n=1 Tax=Natronogracilivirga saccharolytica TaxID=2812953 RepID=A0A8J7RLD1_9BACT|nr:hypothetical protein [Natronogracilivirga saccharolytica]MBP3192960.1 hypothetical protein [Natronogracilivirga saccharolytica]
MKFSNVVKKILSSNSNPMSPQEIGNQIKMEHPDFYGTPSHHRNVEKGHYKDLDCALLAQIYSLTGTSEVFHCDKSTKPMQISLSDLEKTVLRSSRGSEIEPTQRTSYKKKFEYQDKIRNILSNADNYHDVYYKAKTFRGPSLYFHERALATRHDPASLTHLEYVYATLATWGMHRMGSGGSKMCSFEVFSQSIQRLIGRVLEAQTFDFREMSEIKWAVLKEIFCGVKVMASGTSLVGNSKVMHHMLPNVIPPIDRQYTLDFLRENKNIRNDLEAEWLTMKEIISQFFIPVASNATFYLKAEQWVKTKKDYPWDTSILKVVDNLVIGSKK